MKKLFKLSLLMLFALGLMTACSDKDDEDTPIPSGKGKEQKETIANALDKDKELAEFNKLFKDVDLSSSTAQEFTVFAVKGGDTPKSTQSMSLSKDNIKRHIVEGAFTLAKLKDRTSLVAINRDTLYINVNKSGDVLINGMKLNTPSQVGTNMIFVVDEVFPQLEKPLPTNNEYIVRVLKLNDTWNAQNKNLTKGILEGATVTIYDADDKLLYTRTTDKDGVVRFPQDSEDAHYYCTVERKSAHDINVLGHNGYYNYFGEYVVTGLFTSQKELNDANYSTTLRKELGGLKLADIDGDGIISQDDKSKRTLLKTVVNEAQDVYVMHTKFLYPSVRISQYFQQIKIASSNVEYFYESLFDKINTLDKRKAFAANNSDLRALWFNGYRANMYTAMLSQEVDWEKDAQMTGDAMYYNASASLRMVSLFGAAVLVSDTLSLSASRSSLEETYNQIESDIELGVQKMSSYYSLWPSLKLQQMLAYRANKGNPNDIDYRKVSSVGLDVMNSDWSFPPSTTQPSGMLLGQIYLLLAEGGLGLGFPDQSLYFYNTVQAWKGEPALNSLSQSTLRESFGKLVSDENIRLYNADAWGLTSTWGKYKLLPIPAEAFDEMPQLVQNPGW